MKKVLALALVSAMALGTGMTTFAASSTKYTDMIQPLGYSYSGTGLSAAKDEIDLGTIPADYEDVNLPLVYEMFTNDGTTGLMKSSDIRTSKIAVRSQLKSGSKVIDSISLDNKDGRVEVKFVEEWVSTKKQDFEAFVYLTMDGKRKDDTGVTIYGTMENPVIEVYEDYDYVDLSDGYVAEAQDFIRKIEVDLGNGVSIHTKMFKDKKYYGTATRALDESDDVVFAKYPDVDNVVTLKTVGLNSTGDVVKLDTDYSNYYVYDANMNYLGQSNEMLPYSTKYYLANKKLDIEAVEEPAEETEEPSDETEEPSYGNNNNANPGTGR